MSVRGRTFRPVGGSRPRGGVAPVALVALLAAVVLLVGCAGGGSGGDAAGLTAGQAAEAGPAPGQDAAAKALEVGARPIDVRTAAEHSAVHVQGDQLIDVQEPGFEAAVAALPRDVTYVVYCRTGRRSAHAVEIMRAAGLDVLDGGGIDDMAAAGWPTSR